MGVTPVKPASFSSSSHCCPLITGFPVLNFIVIAKVVHKGNLVGIAALALSQLAQTIIKYIFGKNYLQRLYCILRNVQVLFYTSHTEHAVHFVYLFIAEGQEQFTPCCIHLLQSPYDSL